MSQEQNNKDFDNKLEMDGRISYVKIMRLIKILVPICILMTFTICTVMLVLVANLGRKIDRLEDTLHSLQDGNQTALGSSLITVSDIDGNVVDGSEAADIAEAAELENRHVLDGSSNSAGIRKVYLTFDDGPGPNTDKILDILEQYGVKATFFVVGKEGYAEQYRRIVEEGHTLGMHSYSHKYNEIYASLDAYKNDLNKLHDFLYELTGEDCNIVRFPGGSSNTISNVDMRELISYLNEENIVYYDWNVSSGDATGNYKNADRIAANVLESIDQYNNAIILFHDAAGKDSTVEALPIIIEKILESSDTVILPISSDTVKIQHLK
ncbi:MAG: polysaccharide deacetylase [Lachnospiraceae bacterium]|nr:polysaccharide deacetylase [Lachnospiraceae bacterium]